MDGQIFISYRRKDTSWVVTSIYQSLLKDFTRDQLFRDIDSIPYGVDFVELIEQVVGTCDVLIAVIGKEWLSLTDKDNHRMLDNPLDFVRIEIAAALKRNIRVIPVLVDDASMPESNALPEDLKLLARRNAMTISYTRFTTDVDKLIRTLKSVLVEVSRNNITPLHKKISPENKIEKSKLNADEVSNLKIEEKQTKKEHPKSDKKNKDELGTVKRIVEQISRKEIEPLISSSSAGETKPPEIAKKSLTRYWKIFTGVVITGTVLMWIIIKNEQDSTILQTGNTTRQPMSDGLLNKIKTFAEASPQYNEFFGQILDSINFAPKKQQEIEYVIKFVENCRIAKATKISTN